MRNKHELSRAIPEKIKAQARRNCDFGCVICGAIPYDYDHFVVPFAEAKEHNPDDIILLCPTHHRQKGNGLLTIEAISCAKKERASTDPDFRFRLDVINRDFRIHWPANEMQGVHHGILVDEEPILHLRTHENPLEPVLLNGMFRDLRGREICNVRNNEIISKAENVGDFTLVKNRFKYKTPNGDTTLQFCLDPDGLRIEQIFFVKGDAYVYGDEGRLAAGNSTHGIEFQGCRFEGFTVAVLLGSNLDQHNFENVGIDNLTRHHIRDSGMQGHFAAVKIEGRNTPVMNRHYRRQLTKSLKKRFIKP